MSKFSRQVKKLDAQYLNSKVNVLEYPVKFFVYLSASRLLIHIKSMVTKLSRMLIQ